MKVEVVCYCGYKGDDRPVRFRLGGQDYFVEELLDQWYGPQDVFFKVKANNGNVYILRRRSTTPGSDYLPALSLRPRLELLARWFPPDRGYRLFPAASSHASKTP